jgi:four helix bundle protein
MKIRSHNELDVYRRTRDAAMEIFERSKSFPREERYALTDQIRRSSRSICANLAEAFRKRRYPKSFVLKLSDAEAEAAEVQVWLDFSFRCGYIDVDDRQRLIASLDVILAKLVTMVNRPEDWTI